MNTFISINQFLIYLILVIPMRFFLRVKGNHDLKNFQHINKEKGLLIISNHTSKADSFVILSSFPFSVFYKLVPVYFMTSSNYLNTWLQKMFLVPIGSFPDKTNNPNYNSINKSLEIIRGGGKVFIYPEGKIVKSSNSSKPKRGIGIIASQNNHPILPIKIRGLDNLAIKKFLRRRVNTTVSSGHIISSAEAKSVSTDPVTISEVLMRKVYELS